MYFGSYFPDILRQRYERYLPTAFDESLSILEKINKLIEIVNMIGNDLVEVNDNVEKLRKELNDFKELIKNKLIPDAVLELLEEWFNSGKLTHEIVRLILATHQYTYSTVADMVNDKGLKVGDTCRTLGYYKPGDGGGALYTVVSDEKPQHIKLSEGYAKNLSTQKNIVMYGADPEGKIDSLPAFEKGFMDTYNLLVPSGIFSVTDTINIKSNQSLVGMNPSVRENGAPCTIKYDGEKHAFKAVILLGRNPVNQPPQYSSSNITIKNLYIDANNLVGFGIYGTYTTGESEIDNIVITNSLEYNLYVAYTWYLKVTGITSLRCKNNGLAFGMPLMYSDGRCVSKADWIGYTTELNNVFIQNIRSSRAGDMYTTDGAIWEYENEATIMSGYGIGFGWGNGFNARGFISEFSGGANLYVHSGWQPVKNISDGYLEATARGSKKADKDKAGIIIHFDEEKGHTGGSIGLENIFVNNTNGGGIILTGKAGRLINLSNIQQPPFINGFKYMENDVSLTGQASRKFIIPERVYNMSYTVNDGKDFLDSRIEVETRYEWEHIFSDLGNKNKKLYIRRTGDNQPIGVIRYTDRQGNRVDIPYPSNLGEEFVFLSLVPFGVDRIMKGGNTAEYNAPIEIIVMGVNRGDL